MSTVLADLPSRLVTHPFHPTLALNQNTVMAIHQDSYGFIWVGTQSGVHYYTFDDLSLHTNDGTAQTQFYDSFIESITSAADGRVWAASQNGISLLDRRSMTFTPIVEFTEGDEIKRPFKIHYDEQTQQLLLNSSVGLFQIDSSRVTPIVTGNNIQLITPDRSSKSIPTLYADNGQIFKTNGEVFIQLPDSYDELVDKIIVADNQVYLYSGGSILTVKDQHWVRLATIENPNSKPDNHFFIDQRNRAWVLENGEAIWLVDLSTGDYTSYNFDNSNLSTFWFQSALVDDNGLVWLGTTANSLVFFDAQSQLFDFMSHRDNNKVYINSVRVILPVDNSILIGHDSGISVYNKETRSYTTRNFPDPISSITPIGDNIYFLTGRNFSYRLRLVKGQLLLSKVDSLDGITARSALRLNDWILLGTDNLGLVVFDYKQNKLVDRHNIVSDEAQPLITKLYLDSNRRLWVTHLKGVEVFAIEHATENLVFRKIDSLLAKTIVRDILQVNGKHFLFGTHSGVKDIVMSDDGQHQIESYEVIDGLIDNTVYSIQRMGGQFWLATNQGLTLFDYNNKKFINFNSAESLGQKEFNGAASNIDGDAILFGGVSGISVVKPIDNTTAKNPTTWITGLASGDDLNNVQFFPSALTDIGSSDNILKVDFSSVKTSVFDSFEYRYRLNNSDWRNIGDTNEVLLASLQPDNYIFELQAKSNNSSWTDATNYLEFSVKPIFVLSPTMKVVYGVVILVVVHFLFLQEIRRRQIERNALREITARENRLKTALTASEQGLWEWVVADGKEYVYRFNVDNIFGESDKFSDLDFISQFIHPNDKERIEKERSSFFETHNDYDVQYRVKNKSGGWKWIHDKGKAIEFSDDGTIIKASGTYTDITDIKMAELESILSNEIIRSMTDAVVVLDKNREVNYINPAFVKLTGYHFSDIESDRLTRLRTQTNGADFYENWWNDFEERGRWIGELWLKSASGRELLCSLEAFSIKDEELDEQLSILVYTDITDKRKAEEELNYLAKFDSLTGLPNRNLFLDRLDHALAIAKRNETRLSIFFIDLDGFKKVNDSFGHHVGDELLRKVSEIFSSCIRDDDTLARLSGDEFLLLIENVENHKKLNTIADKILKKLSSTIDLAQHQVSVTCSIGISIYPKDSDDANSLIKFADTAMYDAKQKGKNSYSFYNTSMHEQLVSKLNTETHLKTAISNNEMYVVYQPIIDTKTRQIVCAEALLRWNSPIIGEVYPSEFIAIAEESELIIELGDFVLEQACKTIKSYYDVNYELMVAVNVSVRQIMEIDFIDKLSKLLNEYEVLPQHLKIEITESILMANASQTV
ncbi:MAG: diguanylate cyclase, partial [Kangiellaceae bacterium]|nr:diguanylate cyclase [Kangiellaceae bacterium]